MAASFSSPTLYTIANDLSKMQVQTTVDESDIGRISIGQEATFTVDAYPDESFSGTVSQIRLAPVTVQNVVNYTVVISVDNRELKLMPGMTANVKIMVGSARDVLRVPNLALRFQPPADLVDSAAVARARERSGGRGAGDTSRVSMRGPWAGGQGGPEADARRQRFQAVRDSINAAHGGAMDRDALMAEVRKTLGITGSGPGRPGGMRRESSPGAHVVMPQENASYGITQVFPEFQKSASSVAREVGTGRVWVMNAQGKLDPVALRTGLTDGRFTEVHTDALKPGDQIVLGVSSTNPAAEQSASPLTGGNRGPAGGPGGGGGGPRGMR